MPSWPISVDRPQQLRNSPAWNILTCKRTSITNRGNRRVKGLAGLELAAGAEAPPSEEAAAARAFVFLSMQSVAAAKPRLHSSLIPVQQIPRLERQLAGELHDRHAAVNGVDIDHADRPRNGSDFVHQFFVGINNDDGRMIGASVIRSGNQLDHLRLGKLEYLFEHDLHLGCRGRTHDQSYGLSVRPAVCLRLADLYQVRQSNRGETIGLVRHDGQVSRGGYRYSRRDE